MSVLRNLKTIRSNIGISVKLIVVTKKQSVREINQALFLGVEDIAENKVQEAEDKKSFIKGDVKWHFIGHLQSNKVKKAVEIFDMIQSVDSIKLAKKIDFFCALKNKKMSVLIQINISGESQKSGLKEDKLIPFFKELSAFKNIKVLGLMAMAPFGNSEAARPYFRRMKILFEKVKSLKISNIEMKYLSMGMTNDYEIAVSEGANMVRIGEGVFRN